jgi:hypothetical protein
MVKTESHTLERLGQSRAQPMNTDSKTVDDIMFVTSAFTCSLIILIQCQTYEGEAYSFPNDDREQNRLDLQHHIFRLCADNTLNLAPLPENLRSVLDVGTGTGIVGTTKL